MRVPLVVDAPASFTSVDAVVTYDASVYSRPKARRVENGRRATIAMNGAAPGRLRIALASAAPMASGTVATVELRFVDAPSPTGPGLESARVDP